MAFVFKVYGETLQLLSGKTDLQRPLETLKEELLQKMPLPNLKKDSSLLLDLAERLKNLKTSKALQQVLLEASGHLSRLDAANFLKKEYSDPLFSSIQESNQLIIQWVLEQLFVAQGLAKGMGDLRWIRHHDLTAYYYMVHPEDFLPHDTHLDSFNFGRTLHYGREKQEEDLLPQIKDLLKSLKSSKREVKRQLFQLPLEKKSKSPTIASEAQALELLQSLITETLKSVHESSI